LCFWGDWGLGCWMRWAKVSSVHVIVGVENIYQSLHILWLCLKCGFSYWGLPTMNGTAFDYRLFHADCSRPSRFAPLLLLGGGCWDVGAGFEQRCLEIEQYLLAVSCYPEQKERITEHDYTRLCGERCDRAQYHLRISSLVHKGVCYN